MQRAGTDDSAAFELAATRLSGDFAAAMDEDLNTPRALRAGTVGRPLPHCRVRIGDDGEVFVSGATMEGYLGDGRAPPAEIATGDIGHLDEEGFLHISGRKKNLLITSYGRNISPEWVEAALTAAPSIAQASRAVGEMT